MEKKGVQTIYNKPAAKSPCKFVCFFNNFLDFSISFPIDTCKVYEMEKYNMHYPITFNQQ